MAGWGQFFGKLGDLLPGRKESIQNEIDKLLRENDGYQEKYRGKALPAVIAGKYGVNADRIKQLRQRLQRIE